MRVTFVYDDWPCILYSSYISTTNIRPLPWRCLPSSLNIFLLSYMCVDIFFLHFRCRSYVLWHCYLQSTFIWNDVSIILVCCCCCCHFVLVSLLIMFTFVVEAWRVLCGVLMTTTSVCINILLLTYWLHAQCLAIIMYSVNDIPVMRRCASSHVVLYGVMTTHRRRDAEKYRVNIVTI